MPSLFNKYFLTEPGLFAHVAQKNTKLQLFKTTTQVQPATWNVSELNNTINLLLLFKLIWKQSAGRN